MHSHFWQGVRRRGLQPVQQRLQRAVNRLLYGDRDDPYAAIARLGRQLEAALASEAGLPAVAAAIGDALKLPYVAIAPHGDAAMVMVGQPRGELLWMPLMRAGELVGELALSARSPGETFTAAGRRLLDDLARSAGAAVQSVPLSRRLRHSRELVVLVREEEHRRLRPAAPLAGRGPRTATATSWRTRTNRTRSTASG